MMLQTEKQNWRREREREKMEKRRIVDPVTVINWDPHMNSVRI
jgi:hypothetical protein